MLVSKDVTIIVMDKSEDGYEEVLAWLKKHANTQEFGGHLQAVMKVDEYAKFAEAFLRQNNTKLSPFRGSSAK